jgi:hypothetical protein
MRKMVAVHIVFVSALCFALLSSPTMSGTTGKIAGFVKDAQTDAPITGATVTAASPSQSATARTDASGSYQFLSLIPDTYTVTATKDGYDPSGTSGISVFADANQNVLIRLTPATKVLGTLHIAGRSSLNPVRAGTTPDVYSSNPALTKASSTLGGGGGLNNAYSAIAAMPGSFVPPMQIGVNQTVYIRGGYFDQIGYEYDGVPVNRTFDNYPSYSASTLGQQELQVYAGGGTTDSNATGLAGFINQVVRSGTYPGFANLSARIGSPSMYNDYSFEAGGAAPNRSFTYYAGLSSYSQNFRYLSNDNGSSFAQIFPAYYPSNITTNLAFWPAVYPQCNNNGPILYKNPATAFDWNDPGCFAVLPAYIDYPSNIRGTAGLTNFHIAVPHKGDSGADDVQLLYSNSAQYLQYYSSAQDAQPLLNTLMSPTANAAFSPYASTPQWPDFYTFPNGTAFGQLANAPVIGYAFPGSPSGRCLNQTGASSSNPVTIPGGCNGTVAQLPVNYNDARWDLASIEKVQYQHNIGSTAYLRAFGYMFYSNTNRSGAVQSGITGQYGSVNLGATNFDYEVSAHTTGGQLQFADQISSKNQIIATLNYLSSNTLRYRNNNDFNTAFQQTSNLTNGKNCYAAFAGTLANGVDSVNAGDRAPCNDPVTQGYFAIASPGDSSATPSLAQNLTCAGGGPNPIPAPACAQGAAWRLTFTGNQAGINQVKPKLANASLSDEWKPNERLDVNASLRFDRDEFDITQVSDPGKDFWYAAARQEFCYDPLTLQPAIVPQAKSSLRSVSPYVSFVCPKDPLSGVQTVHPDGMNGHILLSDQVPSSYTQTYFLPRIGATYTLNSNNVLRFSAGRYAQQPQNYEVQYNSVEPNLAAQLIGFLPFGFNTPFHPVQAQFSNNYDMSWEHQFNGTDMAMKITPYYRWATDQLYETVSIPTLFGVSPSFTSGTQRSDGVELLFTKGDFNKQGLSGQFAYTYINSAEMWNNYAGTPINPVDLYNQDIQNFNELTKAGGGSACYAADRSGTPAPCSLNPLLAPNGAILNPYYNMSPQPTMDKFGWYTPGLDFGYISPNVFALVASYRVHQFAITPAFSLNEGAPYGTPSDFHGLDPRQCTQTQAALSGLGGVPIPDAPTPFTADYTSCHAAQVGANGTTPGYIWIPNPYTGKFNTFGQYRQPWEFNMGLQLSYTLSPNATANVAVVNLVNSCFGGSNVPWAKTFAPSAQICGYSYNKFFISNFFNGSSPNDVKANGVPLNPFFSVPYKPYYADTNSANLPLPTQVFFQLNFKM